MSSGSPLIPFNPPNIYPLSDEDKERLITASLLTTSFYLSHVGLQRVMGALRLHGGRHGLLTSVMGCAVTSSCLCLAQSVQRFLCERTNNYGLSVSRPWTVSIPGITESRQRRTLRDTLRNVFVGMGVFVALEKGMFRTAFPSSVLTLGVFANSANMLRRSVPSTSAVATEAQRSKIQRLGKRFGCHHCGSRQLLKKDVFIADHMPPTKQANEMAQAWWRRLFKIPVVQRLWPQCQKCFQLQGSAVRTWTHTLVYHNAFKIHHFSPAVAFFLLQDPKVKGWVDGVIEPAVDWAETMQNRVQRFADKIPPFPFFK